jgi:hypothetical protein
MFALASCAACLAACAEDRTWSGPLPAAERLEFEQAAYPVLLRDCAFSECHGAPDRFLQVVGPGRVRLDPTLDPAAPATPDEVELSLRRALSLLATDADVSRSLLLSKPLDLAAGGQGHRGADSLGRNVYTSRQAAGYVALAQWAERVADAARGAQ